MGNDSSVNIAILREVINRILDFIETDLNLTAIDLDKDFYWSIADDVLYTVENSSPQLDCGSLADDLEFVLSAYEHRDQALPLTLLHVAPILRMLAITVPSYKGSKPESRNRS